MTTTTQPEAPARAENAAAPVVSLRGISKRFRRGDGTVATAIDDVSFDVAPGEFVILLGPSGCGKTTLLRTIAGLEHPDGGEIEVHGRTVFSAERKVALSPDKRHLSMIFQSYALWPHMTAFDNVAYPLRSRGKVSRADVTARVERTLDLVGVSELRGQYPNQMSGGQQQRVALARALVGGEDLVLFDEPLSNVDAKVREVLRRELLQMQRELGFAAIYVTHDQTEAMELAHRVAVMGQGRVQQFGTPADIYLRPDSRYVANFVGTSNEIPGTVTAVDGDLVTVETAAGPITGTAGVPLSVGAPAVASFRPENAALVGGGPGWSGEVERTIFLGAHTERIVRVGELTVRTLTLGTEEGPSGAVVVRVPASAVRILASGEPEPVAVTGHVGAIA
jgi:iron(III) transport system ATP-binding protein